MCARTHKVCVRHDRKIVLADERQNYDLLRLSVFFAPPPCAPTSTSSTPSRFANFQILRHGSHTILVYTFQSK